MKTEIRLNREQRAMLEGEKGPAKQMAMRLLVDLAAAAGATELMPIQSAHLSGVSPLTGGLGLRRFLAKLVEDDQARVAVPTTLNAAGCDAAQFDLMHIAVPDFLQHSQEIVGYYRSLGVKAIQSCVPYEWDDTLMAGAAAWAESNAICFANSYCDLMTNRESGLSALASALTGYSPRYGLLEQEARLPNLLVEVNCELADPTDFSILGDWIGKQRRASWRMPYGPIPLLRGLPDKLYHEQKKALTAAAANYGCALLYIEGDGELAGYRTLQDTLHFDSKDLEKRYQQLLPKGEVSLITIGCPQASVGEIQMVAELLKNRKVSHSPDDGSGLPPLWIFTSARNKGIADRLGYSEIIRESGALLLENTCPEVVPYDPGWVRHILTNSMKAEHYLQSGLNNIPTSVMRLADCIAVAAGEMKIESAEDGNNGPVGRSDATTRTTLAGKGTVKQKDTRLAADALEGDLNTFNGRGLPSQGDFSITGRAFVTDTPITFLGFVDRQSGTVQEPGHPADGRSMAGKIALFPKGTGSTVAPYVILELHYRGVAPLAIVNTELDQQSAPACSLENIPYAFGFTPSIFEHIRDGDLVRLQRNDNRVTLDLIGAP